MAIPSHLFARITQRSDSLVSRTSSTKKRNSQTPSAKDVNFNPRKSLGFVETGQPRLGQPTRIKITITESTEFKVS
ncbi:unnamed protein product [Schistosoma curassoni]|uniref:Uncharacterized protein n=1 Tax=Schistosoma curassoni TaxID=6186 RepID=A0A183JFK5_9TREM|nr:unnamed protein product [Schistosoma curassoni]